jgi:hypothetical protein
MPQTGYWPQQWYTSTATTTNYIPANSSYTWTQTGTSQAWTNWNTTANCTITTQNNYTNEVWGQWIVMGQGTMDYRPRVQTAEEIRELDRRNRELTEQRHAARTRARMLLGEFLSDEQKAELESHGRFHVTGSKGRRYCIRAEGQSGNVDLLKPDGNLQARLCAHPRGYLPEGDAWLMQMIEIRHDEDHFLRTANVHRGSLPTLA